MARCLAGGLGRSSPKSFSPSSPKVPCMNRAGRAYAHMSASTEDGKSHGFWQWLTGTIELVIFVCRIDLSGGGRCIRFGQSVNRSLAPAGRIDPLESRRDSSGEQANGGSESEFL